MAVVSSLGTLVDVFTPSAVPSEPRLAFACVAAHRVRAHSRACAAIVRAVFAFVVVNAVLAFPSESYLALAVVTPLVVEAIRIWTADLCPQFRALIDVFAAPSISMVAVHAGAFVAAFRVFACRVFATLMLGRFTLVNITTPKDSVSIAYIAFFPTNAGVGVFIL